MPGPAPAETRRRANTPKQLADRVVLPAAGRDGPVPECPSSDDLLPESVVQWEAWWTSPMATMWDVRFDVFPLARCLELYDRQRRGGDGLSNGELVEIRHIEARFGLDPRSRKELCWLIVDEDGEAQDGPKDGTVTSMDAARRKRVEAKAADAE